MEAREARERPLVLIVERDAPTRELEEAFLREAGFGVEFADDGLSALDRARELRPELVITEVLLPRLDGLALCRRLKEDPTLRTPRVLLLSMLAVRDRARDAGADAFLAKPIARQRLIEVVRALLAPLPEATTRGEA